MTELAVYQPQNQLTEKMEWSRAIAPSGLLPKQYQGNPANLLFAVEYADALGVERIHAITSIHVIEGKPSASADLIAATVRRAGHKLRVTGDDTYAEAHLIRADDPEFTYTARWDIDKAKAAGLAGKAVWRNYPGAMLRSRAITEVARMGASDALFGVVYTPEELGAEIDASGAPLRSQPMSSAPAPAVDRMRDILAPQTSDPDPAAASAAEPPAPEETAGEGEPSGSEPAPITSAQLTKVGILCGELGLTDPAEARREVGAVVGREIKSRKDLSKDEASRVIESFQSMVDQPFPDSEPVDAEVVES